jgi:hypothetical protein
MIICKIFGHFNPVIVEELIGGLSGRFLERN